MVRLLREDKGVTVRESRIKCGRGIRDFNVRDSVCKPSLLPSVHVSFSCNCTLHYVGNPHKKTLSVTLFWKQTSRFLFIVEKERCQKLWNHGGDLAVWLLLRRLSVSSPHLSSPLSNPNSGSTLCFRFMCLLSIILSKTAWFSVLSTA